ncbi:MAG: hypothetical protein QXZ25_00260 [Candidatus Bathyarchaeia archaeon]
MTRTFRVFCFAAVYFLVHMILFVSATIGTYGATPEGAWYLQHPLEALLKMILVLGRNPIMISSFLLMAFYALVYGFLTDLTLNILMRHIKLRRQRSV